MTFLSLLATHPLVVAWATDPAPQDKDVKAGWTAFAVFLVLVAATTVLLISFTRQIRKVNAADEAGVYGSADAEETSAGPGNSEESDTSAPR